MNPKQRTIFPFIRYRGKMWAFRTGVNGHLSTMRHIDDDAPASEFFLYKKYSNLKASPLFDLLLNCLLLLLNYNWVYVKNHNNWMLSQKTSCTTYIGQNNTMVLQTQEKKTKMSLNLFTSQPLIRDVLLWV